MYRPNHLEFCIIEFLFRLNCFAFEVVEFCLITLDFKSN